MDAWLVFLTTAGWRQCWQVTLLIAIVWLTVRVVGRNRPHLACVLWLLVLIKCLTPPIWSSPSGIFCWLERGNHIESQTTADTFRISLKAPPINNLPPGSDDDEADAVSVQVNSQPKINDLSGESTPFNNQSSNAPRKFWSARTLLYLTLATWLVGSVASLLITATRLWLCWRSLRSAGRVTDAELERMLNDLCTQVGLRRTVKLWITDSLIGPAVVGLWQPVVILPTVLTRHKTGQELTPLLAHELVHIRRGDLWLGLLQLLTQTLWWFHPLVRLACRWLTREAERCCDEAVIAHLSCTPAAYARGLLDVVALKQQLQPLPSFPGVRPVDVTRGRLERIMELRQGCRKQTPWWCWVVLAAAAAVILPGAAIVLSSRETTSNQFLTEPRTDLINYKRIDERQFEVDDLSGDQTLATSAYYVEDLFERLMSERQETAAAAREHLAAIVQSSAPGPWEIHDEAMARQATATDEARFDREAKLGDDPTKRSLGWTDAGLLVCQTTAGHERIQRQLAALRKHGFSELTVEVRILSGPVAGIDQLATTWKLIGASAEDEWGTESRMLVESNNRATTQQGDLSPIRGTVESVVEKQVPAMIGFLTFEETRSVIQAAQHQSPTTNIVQAPKVSVFNGQSARIADNTLRPFVVGVKPVSDGGQQPQIRVVSEGTTIRLRPELKSDDAVQLDLSLILSHVRSVETAEFSTGPGSTPITVQVPEVGMTKLKTTVDMPLEQTLAINLPSSVVGTKFKGGCVLVTVYRSPDDSQRAGGPRTIGYSVTPASHHQPISVPPFKRAADGELIEKVYMVGDLVLPVPFEPMVISLPYVPTAGAPPKPLTPDFETLIELLTTTISPQWWAVAGGPGKITINPNRLSLFINTTEDIHCQIADTFEQLRRLQDVQICWSIAVVEAQQREVEQWVRERKEGPLAQLDGPRTRTATLTPQELKSFQDGVSCKWLSGEMKITGFNGQAPHLHFESLQENAPALISRALMQANVTADFRFIRMMLAVDAKSPAATPETDPIWNQPFNVPRGHSLLIDLDPQRWKASGTGSPGNIEGSDGLKPSTLAASKLPSLRRFAVLTPTVLLVSNQAYSRGLTPLDDK